MTSRSRSDLRILVAEDDPSHQRIIDIVLKRAGYTPTIVSSGADALDTLELNHYDVLLMDLAMPNMDGFETMRHLKSLDSSRRPYTIALTVFRPETTRERCQKAGMNDFLTKPLRESTLAEALERFKIGAVSDQ